jgi:hypothetical protein
MYERFSNSGIFSADVHAAKVPSSFFLVFCDFPFWLFLVVCTCVIAAESRVKWKNAQVMGFTTNIKTKNEICEKNIISRIFVVKKNRGYTNIRILVLIFVVILLPKSKQEIPY